MKTSIVKENQFSNYVRYGSYLIILISSAVLIGWQINLSLQNTLHSRLVPMNPLTAVGFSMAAFWLLITLSRRLNKSVHYKYMLGVIETTLILIGGFKLLDMWFGVAAHVNRALSPQWHIYGRMSPTAAVNFIALGIAMLLTRTKLANRFNLLLIPLFTVFIISFIALFGYSIGNDDILAMRPFPNMAVHTTFCFIVITGCMLFLFPENRFLQPFLSVGLGGYSARKLSPYVILVPFTLGFLRYHGERYGLYNTGFGISIQVVVSTLIFLFLIWREAVVLNQMDAKRREAEKRMEEYSHEMEQFAFIASHDLREPLRKISTFANMIQNSSNLEGKNKDYIDKIVATSKRMQTFISDLLDFTKLVHFEETTEAVDLNVIVENVKADYEIQVVEKNAVISCGKLPEIDGIRFQINQLFYNLVGNALKFSKPSEPPFVQITATKMSPDEVLTYPALVPGLEYYHFKISDNGIGFYQEDAIKIFAMFGRLNSKSSFAGSGIGLAICKKIVSNHHGEIYAESEFGKGSLFHFMLPVKFNRQDNGLNAT